MATPTFADKLLILSEASEQLAPSSSAADITASTEAAKLVGFPTYYIPQDFSRCENAENALWHIPSSVDPRLAFWIGYIPDLDRYRSIYQAALSKGIRLVNSPEEHQTAQEFDHAYPKLGDLTPKSLIVQDVTGAQKAAEALGYPVFIKGIVQSRKARGWKACVANDAVEIERAVSQLLELNARSRGRVVVRSLVKLRHERISAEGFPFGREYRVFLFWNSIVGIGYYWDGSDALTDLSPDEMKEISNLAVIASKRVNVPFIAVDIGQTEDMRWIVIETGDAQFSGLRSISSVQFWADMKAAGHP